MTKPHVGHNLIDGTFFESKIFFNAQFLIRSSLKSLPVQSGLPHGEEFSVGVGVGLTAVLAFILLPKNHGEVVD